MAGRLREAWGFEVGGREFLGLQPARVRSLSWRHVQWMALSANLSKAGELRGCGGERGQWEWQLEVDQVHWCAQVPGEEWS